MDNQSLDKKIKDQIDARHIEPSSMAWDRLDAMLTIEDKPKRFSNFTVFNIMMCIAFFIAAYSISKINHPKLVESETIIASESNTSPSEQNDVLTSTVSNNEDREMKQSEIEIPINKASKPSIASVSNRTSVNNNTSIQKVSGSEKDHLDKLNIVTDSKKVIESEIVATSEQASEISIDAKLLLESVERNSKAKTSITTNLKKSFQIDSRSLLAEAEYKSEKSFLSKFFKGVQETSSSLMTSVNARNIEKE